MPHPDSLPRPAGEWDAGRRFVLLAAFLWSLAGLFIKGLDLHPLTITFYRSLFAALAFTPFLRRSGRSPLGLPEIACALSYTAAITAFVTANKLTSAANAIVLQYTAPIFVFLYARLVAGEKIEKPYGIALAVSMAGVAVLALGGSGRAEISGVSLALLSGFFFAVYMVSAKSAAAAHPIYLTWLNNAVCALLLLPAVKSRLAVSPQQAGALLLMGAVQLGLPYYFFSKALLTVPVQEAALIALIEPVLNPLWVAWIIGEIPSGATLAGGIMILTGLAIRYAWPPATTAAKTGAPGGKPP